MSVTVQASPLDRVRAHLRTRGCDTPVPADLREDLDELVLRAARTEVELSPYMRALLRAGER